jgi:peptidoglycan hydrolase CwlO-like protein
MTRLNGLQAQLEKKLAAYDETEKRAQELEAEISRTLAEKNETKAELKAANERIKEMEAQERLRINSSSQSLLGPKK